MDNVAITLPIIFVYFSIGINYLIAIYTQINRVDYFTLRKSNCRAVVCVCVRTSETLTKAPEAPRKVDRGNLGRLRGVPRTEGLPPYAAQRKSSANHCMWRACRSTPSVDGEYSGKLFKYIFRRILFR